MNKALLIALSGLMIGGVAVAQDDDTVDHRSAWAKSQDMYVEPTLRITETDVTVTPEQAAQDNIPTRQVPAGSVTTGQSRTSVIGPDGQVIEQNADTTRSVPASTAEPAVEPTTQTQGQGAPVEDFSRPAQ